jgi:hypothetical protein
VTQTSLCGRFLRSFDRQNELFAVLPETVPSTHLAEKAPDAVGDNVARFADPAADVTEIGAVRDGDKLRLRLTLRGPASRRVLYRMQVRANADGVSGTENLSRYLVVNMQPWMEKNQSSKDPRMLEATISLSELGISETHGTNACLWIAGETRWSNKIPVPVDKTGYRAFTIPGLSQ